MATLDLSGVTIPAPVAYDKNDGTRNQENLCYALLGILQKAQTVGFELNDETLDEIKTKLEELGDLNTNLLTLIDHLVEIKVSLASLVEINAALGQIQVYIENIQLAIAELELTVPPVDLEPIQHAIEDLRFNHLLLDLGFIRLLFDGRGVSYWGAIEDPPSGGGGESGGGGGSGGG